MIVRSVTDVIGTARDVHGQGWKSRRVVLAGEGPDYSVHETTLDAGVTLRFEYQHHRETVYCIAGEGTIEDLGAGRVVRLGPGGLYSAGIGEDHIITTDTEMKLVCIFSPPLAGDEEAT
jgi:L-ectoine synthase